MKRILCVFLLVGLMASLAWADVEINEENFPDEVFRAYISEKFDTDSDGVLSDAEIAGVTEIKISEGYTVNGVHNKRVSSLQGVKYFTALTYTFLEQYDQ